MAKKLIEKHGTGIVNDKPRLPEAENLGYGQLAVNYTDENEVVAFKNVENEMVTIKTAKQNEKTMIKQNNNYFKSYDTIDDYNAAQNEFPTVSWVEDERTLQYEIVEDEPKYNIIFDASDPIYNGGRGDLNIYINPNNLGIKYLNLNCWYPEFKNKIFTTFEVDGVEMSSSYKKLESDLEVCYTVDMGVPRKGFLKVNSKPYRLGRENVDNPLHDGVYSVFVKSDISYIEIDEDYQKMFYEPITDTYAFTLGLLNINLKEVKFIGNWLPKGEAIFASLYGLLTAFKHDQYGFHEAKRGIKVLIPKDNTTYGSPSDSNNIDDVANCTFYGIINGINVTLANQGCPYGITVETY